MPIYYIYAYLREDDTPYYIGKGKGNRALAHHQYYRTPKDKSRIVFLETNLTNVGALALERRYIRWYGRKDLGTGILRNMTDGGDGATGSKHNLDTLFGGEKHRKETQKKRVLNGTHPCLNNIHLLHEINSKKIANRTHHFLTDPPTKGATWWNNGSINKLCKEYPGQEFIAGRLFIRS